MAMFIEPAARAVVRLDIRDISPNPAQPRRQFPQESLDSLARSISEHGLLSPLIVRRINIGQYELVAGERRLRALKLLGRTHADAFIVTAYDSESAVMALIENLQREQLHYLEEAEACRAILDSQPITQEELARKLGRSPSALANRLRLIRLAPDVKNFLMESSLTERHARALLLLDDPTEQLALARAAAGAQLTVRQLEQRIERRPSRKRASFHCMSRDHRLYINAVIDTVEKLKNLGAHADATVNETDSLTEICIIIRKTAAHDQ